MCKAEGLFNIYTLDGKKQIDEKVTPSQRPFQLPRVKELFELLDNAPDAESRKAQIQSTLDLIQGRQDEVLDRRADLNDQVAYLLNSNHDSNPDALDQVVSASRGWRTVCSCVNDMTMALSEAGNSDTIPGDSAWRIRKCLKKLRIAVTQQNYVPYRELIHEDDALPETPKDRTILIREEQENRLNDPIAQQCRNLALEQSLLNEKLKEVGAMECLRAAVANFAIARERMNKMTNKSTPKRLS